MRRYAIMSIMLFVLALYQTGCTSAEKHDPTNSDLMAQIIGTWAYKSDTLTYTSTYRPDGRVRFSGTVVIDTSNLTGKPVKASLPFIAIGKFKIQNDIMTTVIESSSGDAAILWSVGKIRKCHIIKLSRRTFIYKMDNKQFKERRSRP